MLELLEKINLISIVIFVVMFILPVIDTKVEIRDKMPDWLFMSWGVLIMGSAVVSFVTFIIKIWVR